MTPGSPSFPDSLLQYEPFPGRGVRTPAPVQAAEEE